LVKAVHIILWLLIKGGDAMKICGDYMKLRVVKKAA